MADKEAREPDNQNQSEPQAQDGGSRQMSPDGQAHQQPDEETLDQAVVLGADQYDQSATQHASPERSEDPASEEELDPSLVLDRDQYDQNAIRRDGVQRPGEPEPEEALGRTAALNRDQYSQSEIAAPAADTDTTITRRSDPESRTDGPEQQEESLGRTTALNRDQYSQSAINQPSTQTETPTPRRSEPTSRVSGTQKPEADTFHAQMPKVDRTEESVLIVQEPSVRVVIGDRGGPAPVRRVESKEPPAEEASTPEPATRVNQAPVANADRGEGRADSQFEIDVLANDTDGNADDTPATFTLDQVQIVGNTGPAGSGQVAIVNNRLVFTPGSDFDALAEGETATVTVRYQMSDDEGASASSTATVIVTGVNAAPDAVDDTLLVQEGGSHTFTVADFGFRDIDTSDSLQSVTITRLPAAGSLNLNSVAVTTGQVITVEELASLTFTPENNANGDGYADLQFTVSDGRADSPVRTLTIDVGEVNDAPTAQDKTLSINEDGSHTFAATDFGFNDIDTGDTLQSVTITRLPSVGSLTLNDTPVILNQVITASDIGNLKYTPAAHASGSSYADLQFTVSDGELSSSAQTVTFNVTPVTDAPTIALDNDVLVFDEELIADTDDQAAWDVTGSASFWSGDRLSMNSGDTPVSGVVEQPLTVHQDINYALTFNYQAVNTNPVSTRVDIVNEATGTVLATQTISASSTVSRQLSLDFSADFSGTAILRLTDVSTSGLGRNMLLEDFSLMANTVDNPVVLPRVTGVEDQAIAVDLSVVTPDTDGSETLAIELSGIPSGVVLGDGTNTLTSAGAAIDVSDWDLGSLTLTPPANNHDDFTVTVKATTTETATGTTSVTNQAFSVHIASVNDAPTVADQTLTVAEDTPYHFTAADFSITDPDVGDTHTVTIEGISGGSLYKAYTTPDLSFDFSDGNDPVNDAEHSIHGTLDGAEQVTDGEQGEVIRFDANTDHIQLDQAFDLGSEWTISVRFQDLFLNNNLWNTLTRGSSDHQVIFHNSTGELGTYNNGAATFQGSGFFASSITDGWHDLVAVGENGTTTFYLDGVEVGTSNFQSTSDITTIGNWQSNQPFAEQIDNFQIFNEALTPEQVSGDPIGTIQVSVNETLTTAELGGLIFIPDTNTHGDGAASIDFKATDNHGADSTTETLTFNVTSVNDVPTAQDKTLSINEDGSHTFMAADFGFNDADAGDTLQSVTMTRLPSVGSLTLNDAPVSLNQVISSSDIGNLKYTPVANANGSGYADLQFTVSDGSLSSTTQTLTFDVTAVNDAPVLPTLETQGLRGEVFETGSGIPNLATVDNLIANQAATATFTATELNYSGGTTLSGFLGDDGNSLSGSQNLTPETFGIRLTGWIEMPAGTHSFTINSDDGVRLTIGNEVVIEQDGTAHFTGLNGQYTAAESGLVPIEIIYYEYGGGQVLEVFSSLTGNAALDTSVLSTSALTLDAIDEDIDGASNTGTTVSAFLQNVTIGEVDGSAQDAIAITSVDDSNGIWQYSRDNGATWTAVDDGSLAENHALLLAGSDQFRFVPDANYHGHVAFDFRAWDQSSGTAGSYGDASTNGGTTAFSQQSGEGHLFVNPVNDAPVAADDTLTIAEDGSHTFAAADFGFTDADSGDTLQSVTITQLPGAGSLRLNGTDVTLNQTINATDIGNLVFTPVANAHGDDYADLQFTVSDGTASSATKTLTFDVTSVQDPLVQTGQGLRGELFDAGSIPNLATMDNLIATETPVATFTASSLNYQNGANAEGFLGTDGASLTGSQTMAPETFGIRLSGFIRVPVGTHDFTINADDGFRLTVGGEVVVQQDGTGMFNGVSGQYVATEPGLVPIEIVYYEHTGGQNFQVTSSLTGGGTLDNSVLFAHALPAMAEDLDAVTNTGTRVSDLLTDGTITDGDGAVPESMAITSVDDSNGAWQYSRDGGTSWQAVDDGSLAENHALLLADTDLLRFVPDTHYSGAASFDFRAWDQTSGTAGSYTDTSSNGGTTAFSTAISSAAVEITPVTDAPAVTLNNSGSNDFLLDTELITNGSVNGTDGWDFSGNVRVNSGLMQFSSADSPVTGVVEQSFVIYQDVNYALNLDYRSWNTNLVSARVEIVDSASGTVLASQNVSSNTASLQALSFDFTGIATGNAVLRITDTTPNTASTDLAIDNVSIQAPSADNDAMPAVVSGQEDQAIAVDLTVATPDSDGSETLAIELSGIPSGVVLNDGTNTLTSTGAAIDASGWNLDSLTLTPPANSHDDFTFSVKATATETATGTTNVTNEAITVHIEAVNDAPTAQDKTLSINEDGSHTFAAADFGFDDIDTGDTLQSITITRLPSVGSLTLNDTPVTLNQAITAANIGNLKYAPAAHASGNSYADLQFTVSDGGLSSSAQTLTFNVSPVTDAPTVVLNNDVYEDLSLDTNLISNGQFATNSDWTLSGSVGISSSRQSLGFSGGESPVTGVAEQTFVIHPDINYSLSLGFASANTNPVSGRIEIIDVDSGTVLASQNVNTSSPTYQTLNLDFTGIAAGNAIIRITDTTAITNSRDLYVDNVSIQAESADNPNHNPQVNGTEDQPIAVDLSAATPDSDGSETLAIELSGIPSGVVLSDGTNTLTSTGAAIDVSDWDLGSLTLTPPANNHDDFTFTVRATATETATSTTNVTTQAINVHIEAVNDPPVIAEGDTVDTSAAFVFSEGTGTTVADQSGNNNAMTLSGTATWGTGHDGTGNALEMDGSSSAAINGLETGGAMTVAAWVEFDSTGNWSRVIDFGDGAGVNNIVLGSHVENGLGVHIFNGAGQLVGQLRVEDVITANQWTHVAFTVDDAGQIALYVDGASVGTATMTTGAPPEVLVRSNNFVGADNWNANQRLDGRLDDLLIANESLDANEISNLYRTSQLSDFTDAHFSLDEHSANGTVVGQVSATDVEDGTSLTYALADNAGGRFAINSSTGEITVADGSLLDHDVAGSHTLRVRVTDSGGLSSERDFVVQVADVSEAPTAQDKTLTITEDGSHTFAVTDFGFSDGDSGDTLQSVTITQLPSAGSLTLDDSPVTANQVITAADITQLKFTPDANANGTGYADLTFTVSDGSLSSAAQTLTFDVTAVNDPPVIAEGDTVDTSAAFVFSEGTGTTVADESGNNNAMTLSGTATWGTGHGGTGNALEMDGSSSAAINGLETGGAMTVAAWVEFDATGGWSRIIDFGNGAAQHNIVLGSNVENGLGVHIYNGTGQLIGQLEVPNVIAANQWAHVAFTIDDAGEITLYVDGESVGTATTTTGAPPEVLVRSNNLVGNDNWGGTQRLDGRLDDLVVVNEALDATQVSNLYQANALSDFTDAHFTLDENSANGTVVGQVSGSDTEDGTNVTYALADDAGGRFAINSTTGEITVADSSLLDHETDGSHTLRVRVTDSGGLSSERDFVVQVADVNEAPTAVSLGVEAAVAPTATDVTISPPQDIAVQSAWHFNDSYDSEAGGNSFSGASPTFVTGPNDQVENAIHFDGGNAAFVASAAVSETSAAIGLWFRTTGSGTLMEVTTASALTSHDRNVWIDSDGRINARIWTGSGDEVITSDLSDTFNDGEWHYVVHSYGGDLGGQTLFVDGQSVASGNVSASAFNTQDSIRLGSSVSTASGGSTFSGDIGGLQVFDQALTANDIAAAMLRPDAVLAENTTTAVTIGALSVTDADSDTEAFGQHTFTVSDNRFEVVNGELRLKAGQSLDHETESSIDVTVTATDNNNTGFTRNETFTILVQDVNEAPTAQDKTLSLNEDESHTFAAADFGFTDVDSGDSLQSVTITRLPSDGSLMLNDTPVTANQEIAASELGNLTYTPAANAHGTGYADLQFTASDGEASSAVQTLTFDVASVNDAPVFDSGPVAQHEWHFDNSYDSEAGSQAFAGATPTFTSGPPNSQFANAVAFDGSATTFNVPLNVSETAYTVSFWFRADNAGGLLQIEGGGHDRNVYLNANGTITARVWQEESITSSVGETYNDGQWHHVVHTFGGAVGGQTLYVDGGEVASGTMSASAFTGQTHLRLGYSSQGDTHLDGAIAGLQVFDDAVTATEVQQLFAPDSVVAIDENTTTATTLATLDLTDPDSETDPFGQHIFTVSDNRFEVVSGELRLKAGQSLDHETEGRITVTVTATDNNGTGLSADKVFTVLVQDVNDAPTVADNTLTVAEDTAYHFTAADFSIADQDADDTHTVTIEAITGGTLYQAPRPELEFLFEEATGTTTDDDRNNVQGTLTGVTWSTDTERGGVVTFDHNSDRITLAQPYDLGSEWTITTEFRNLRTDGSTWQSLVEGNGDVQILVNSSTGEIGTWQNSVGFHGTGVNLSNLGNDWHSLTAVGQDGKTHFYLDDNYLGTADYQSTGIIDTVGNNGNVNNQAFADNLNDFRIYNTAQLPDLDVSAVQGDDSPILHLNFEDSANLGSDTEQGVTGTSTGVEQVNDAEQGNVARFDGSSTNRDRINLDQPVALGNEWTVTTRFKDLYLGNGSIGALTRNGTDDIQVEVSDAGILGTRDRLPSNTFHSSGFDMSTLSDDWHTLTAVGSGGKTYFYIDNVHVGTSNYQSTQPIESIGSEPGGLYPFAEFIDDFQVFDEAYFADQGEVPTGSTEVNAGDTVAAEDAGDLRFVPDQDVNGDGVASIDFKATDNHGADSTTETLTFNVTPVNDAPEVSGAVTVTAPDNLDAHTVTEAFLLGNASDVDGDTLSVQDVSINGVTAHRHDFQTSFAATGGGTGGSVAVNGNTLTLTSGTEENVVLIDTTGGSVRDTNLHLDFTVAPTDGHTTRNNFIVFDYVDANNYKTIGSYDGSGSPDWRVEQWTSGTSSILARFNESSANSNINTDRHYEVDIIDNRVSLTVDGVEKVAHQFSENVSDGEIGVMNRGNSVSTYTLNGADWDIYPDNEHAVYDNNDGTWTILPGDDHAGDLTLDYNVSDGALTTAATAVIPVDRTPDASIELSSTTGISDDVLPVETTAGGDTLTVTSVNGQTVAGTGTTSIAGEFGTLDIAADGSWTYNLDAAYASADLDSDLVARWTFDEASGTTVADTSTVDSIADDGTLNGATFVSDGISGSAVAFDGSNDRIDVANSTELNTYTGTKTAYTISLAFKVDPANALTGTQVLYEQGGIGNGFNIYIRGGNLYVGAWSDGNGWSNGAFISTSLAGLEGGWHSVSLVLDATSATASERTLTGYLDGIDFGTKTGAKAVSPHSGAIAFGGMSQDTQIDTGDLTGNGHYFQGEIDEARIYNRALSDTEVRVLGQIEKSETFTYEVSDGTHFSTSTLAIDVQHTLDSTDGISGTVGDETLTGTAFGEQIEGLAGMDTLVGNGGDDWLVGGAGNDTMTGGAGSDTFVWIAGHEGTSSSVAIDTITDFNATAGGDAIDLSLLLSGETETTLDQYLNVSVTGGNTEIDVTPAGAGGDVTQKIILEGVDLSGLGDNTAILNTLLQNGNLHIDG